MEAVKPRLLLLFAFVVLIPTLKANIAEYDEVWQKRAEDAKEAAREAYQPNPEEVTHDFNKQVHK